MLPTLFRYLHGQKEFLFQTKKSPESGRKNKGLPQPVLIMKKITILTIGLFISAATVFAHSDAFKPQFVDTLVEHYLAIQKGLAADDLAASQAGAATFLKAMKNAPHDGEAHEESMELTKPAKIIAGAIDIKVARTAFLDLSTQMTSLVQHVGVTSDAPLYEAFCPMAFDNKGGSWIQADETVSNPYYGSMMLRCGSIKKQIAGKEDNSSHSDHSAHGKMPIKKDDHSGHSH
jgi:Cu(I)/Ag(I) efflux system membrane fusion protein